MTSSSDLRREEDVSGADADDRTIQKPPDAVAAIEQEAERDRDRTVMSAAPASVPRPSAVLSPVSSDKLPPPPTNPLRPRMASSPGAPSSSASPFAPASRPIPTPQPFAAKAEATKLGVARAEPVKNEPAKSDSKSDVRTVQSRRGSGSEEIEGPPTLESEPPPSEPATSPKSPAMVAPSLAPVTPKMPNAPNAPAAPKSTSAPSPITPKMLPKPLAAKPASVASPSAPKRTPSKPELKADADADGDGDSITATAPRVPAPIIPLSAPNQVEIRTLDDDDDSADETEVKTLSADLGELVRNARPKTSEAEATDDSVTAQAPVVPGSPSTPKKAPAAAVIRIGQKSLMPKLGGAYNPDEEDSVTARSLEVGGADFPDDSVTTQSPSVGSLPEPIDGETEGTTKRVRKKPAAKGAPDASEADERDDSVTAAAPGHLTNMLRVIASPTDEVEAVEDHDPVAHTQVMLNAPVKAPPNSESALRATAPAQLGLSGERASLGALGVPQRHSAPMRAPMTSDPALGALPPNRVSHVPFAPAPIVPEDRKPPYALVVGVVAAISILIPVLLFVILSQSGPDGPPRVTAQPSPDPVGLTGSRPKAGRPAPSSTPPVRTNNGGGAGTNNRSPFRR